MQHHRPGLGSRMDSAATVAVVVVLAVALGVVAWLGTSGVPGAGTGTTPRTAAGEQPPADVVAGNELTPAGPLSEQLAQRRRVERATASGGAGRTRAEETCLRPDVTRALRVMTYNIKSGFVRGRGQSLATYADQIRAAKADVVLLQEVDRFRGFSGGADQPSVLADSLGMAWAFGTNVMAGSGQYGTAILSRWPIIRWTNTHLPNRPGMQQRGLLEAVVDVDGLKVEVFSTHLQNKSEPMRMEQVAAINEVMADQKAPTILGGDFNSWPDAAPMRVLGQTLVDAWPLVSTERGATHPSSAPRGRIDALLHRGAVVPLQGQVVPSTLSDHLPVVVDYQVSGPGPEVCVPLGSTATTRSAAPPGRSARPAQRR